MSKSVKEMLGNVEELLDNNICNCYHLPEYLNRIEMKIEVAFFKSMMWDASGADESIRKGKVPKEYNCPEIMLLGRGMKNDTTVIAGWSAISCIRNHVYIRDGAS